MKWLTTVLNAFLMLLFNFVFVIPSLAQTAQISGLIRDPQQQPVPNAKVVLKEISTGIQRSLLSGSSGLYAFNFLSPGQYSLTVSAPGFAQASSVPFTLETSQRAPAKWPSLISTILLH